MTEVDRPRVAPKVGDDVILVPRRRQTGWNLEKKKKGSLAQYRSIRINVLFDASGLQDGR
jgi:hypothetical protein